MPRTLPLYIKGLVSENLAFEKPMPIKHIRQKYIKEWVEMGKSMNNGTLSVKSHCLGVYFATAKLN